MLYFFRWERWRFRFLWHKNKSTEIVPNIDNFDNTYIFGQCKHYNGTISKATVSQWISDINDFKSKKGHAYNKEWPYKEDSESPDKTNFFFCCSSNLDSGAKSRLKENNIKIIYPYYLAFLFIVYMDAFLKI